MAAPPPASGIWPMLYAFFGADGALDRDAMRRQVEFCVGAGVSGVAVLGLATEVGKLQEREKRQIIAWAAEDLAGRLPFAVTISGTTPDEHISLAGSARAAGAQWLILQPPPDRALSEAACHRFFDAVMDAVPGPLAIQNAPQYLGVGLGDEGLLKLARDHANFTLLKGESSALAIRQTIAATEGRLAVFNGRGGLELTDNLRAGCAGIIPGAEGCDAQARIFALMRSGRAEDEGAAEESYRAILPLLVFLMQSLATILCYGKRLLASRIGIEQVFDRAPALAPDRFGLAALRRHAAWLTRNDRQR